MSVVSDFQAIVDGSSWAGAARPGTGAFLTYSFETAPAAYLAGTYNSAFLSSFSGLASDHQDLARQALQAWGNVSGLTFLEVPSGMGDLRFGMYDFGQNPEFQALCGFAWGPAVTLTAGTASSSPIGGDIFLKYGIADESLYLHEVGHALGLKHPFEGGVTLDPALDDTAHTVMSYNQSAPVTGLGSLDLDAIKAIYGPYTADGGQLRSWSWDAGNYILHQTGSVANETIIGVAASDVILGDAGNDYIAGFAGNDRLEGGDGADRIFAGDGDDTLIGGSGVDSLYGEAGNDVFYDVAEDQVSGGAGADRFVFSVRPAAPARITDFTLGVDRLDLSALLAAMGYGGTAPISDGYVIVQTSSDGATVLVHPDAAGSAGTYALVDIVGATSSDLTWSRLTGAEGPASPAAPSLTLQGNDAEASRLAGYDGNDTLIAGHRADTLSGGAGADVFQFKVAPWASARVTDFTVGTDRLDLTPLLSASGYTGSDPVGAGYVSLVTDGAGGTHLYVDVDGPSAANPWPFLIATLDGVPRDGVSWAKLSTGVSQASASPQAPPPKTAATETGELKTGKDSAPSTLTGGAGDDTLGAAHRADVLTGNGGSDQFRFSVLPWAPSRVTDFKPGEDKLDLRPLFQAASYGGSDPGRDGYVSFLGDGSGGTQVYFAPHDGTNGGYPYLITILEHVAPSQIGVGDWLFN